MADAARGKNSITSSVLSSSVAHPLRTDLSFRNNLSHDISAGLVVFLIALPLCLGIALASGAPLMGGLIAGIVGGIVVQIFSGSELSVSGPAAGLTTIVAAAILSVGSYQNFLTAVILAGIIQCVFSTLPAASIIRDYVPSSVIRGMLAAIGIIILCKQIPYALGHEGGQTSEMSFLDPSAQIHKIAEFFSTILRANPTTLLITVLSLAVLFIWEHPRLKRISSFKFVPAPLIVVVLGIVLNETFRIFFTDFYLRAEAGHLVQLPATNNFALLASQLTFPNIAELLDLRIYSTALTIAVVASLETVLSLEAVDKLDPYKRVSNTNKELRAQGIGNIVSGALGGLPITSVIVRSSANVYAGGRTRTASIVHGIFLLVSLLFLAPLLNRIPLASLAAILVVVGYKLTPPKLYRQMLRAGREQFLTFIITVISIVFTDLLTGIVIGLCVAMFFVILGNHQLAVILENADGDYCLSFTKDMTFINKNELKSKLSLVPENSFLLIDGSKPRFIDIDIYDTIADFAAVAPLKNIHIEYKNFEPQAKSLEVEH